MLPNSCFVAGFYAYTEASEGDRGNVAKLESVEITSSPHQCVSFWYHMHGQDIGSLRVYQIYSSQNGNKLIWTVTDAKGTEWIYQAINLTYNNDSFKIKFEGVRGRGRKGDIALDDITIRNNNCNGMCLLYLIVLKYCVEQSINILKITSCSDDYRCVNKAICAHIARNHEL